MRKGKIVVLGGGTSSEREVSLRSSHSVMKALIEAGYEPVFMDPKDGKKYLDFGPNDIILPILHGSYGEDGQLQTELQSKLIPFLGSGATSSANCFDKWKTREIATAHGIKMPRGSLVSHAEYLLHPLAQQPHVLKQVDGGSSIGTYIIRNPDNRLENAEKLFINRKMLLEQLIDGVEITVPILDKAALPVIEIQPPDGGIFDYENKYNGATRELCPPRTVSLELQEKAQSIAEQLHALMECRHLSRVDFMIDLDGEPYLLEINTMPGLTDQSLFPKAAKESGITMAELTKTFVNLVVRDAGLHN